MRNDINCLWKISNVFIPQQIPKRELLHNGLDPIFLVENHLMVTVNDEAKQEGTKKMA